MVLLNVLCFWIRVLNSECSLHLNEYETDRMLSMYFFAVLFNYFFCSFNWFRCDCFKRLLVIHVYVLVLHSYRHVLNLFKLGFRADILFIWGTLKFVTHCESYICFLQFAVFLVVYTCWIFLSNCIQIPQGHWNLTQVVSWFLDTHSMSYEFSRLIRKLPCYSKLKMYCGPWVRIVRNHSLQGWSELFMCFLWMEYLQLIFQYKETGWQF